MSHQLPKDASIPNTLRNLSDLRPGEAHHFKSQMDARIDESLRMAMNPIQRADFPPIPSFLRVRAISIELEDTRDSDSHFILETDDNGAGSFLRIRLDEPNTLELDPGELAAIAAFGEALCRWVDAQQKEKT